MAFEWQHFDSFINSAIENKCMLHFINVVRTHVHPFGNAVHTHKEEYVIRDTYFKGVCNNGLTEINKCCEWLIFVVFQMFLYRFFIFFLFCFVLCPRRVRDVHCCLKTCLFWKCALFLTQLVCYDESVNWQGCVWFFLRIILHALTSFTCNAFAYLRQFIKFNTWTNFL